MMAVSRCPPLVLMSILPETQARRTDSPPPVKESAFDKISRDYRFRNSNFIICDEVVINQLNFS